MIKRIYSYLAMAAVVGLAFACSEESNPQREADTFTSIFDSNQFDDAFFPIDIQQTTDGGYIILAEKDLPETQLTGVYMIKADKYGNYVNFIAVDSLFNPVGRMINVQNRYYFFCRKPNTGAVLAHVDSDLNGFNIVDIGTTFPAAASKVSDNQAVLLSYNNDGKQTIIQEISLATDGVGAVQRSKAYTIGVGDKSEEPIMRHYLKTGKQFPFDVGVAGNGIYYYNGFFDYTFSLVFTDMSDAEQPIGRVNGQQYNGGFSAVSPPATGSAWATARFNFGENFLIPKTDIVATTTSNASTIKGFTLPELIDESKVKILRATINNKNVLVYAADTQTRQVGLYFYDEAAGTFMSSRYLGFSNPFQVGNITATSDGGLAVVGTTYIAGRFARIFIFKLSKEEVASNVK